MYKQSRVKKKVPQCGGWMGEVQIADNLPQSKLFRIEIKVKMCSGHLYTLGIIPEFILIAAIINR
jgi:hypothetical protein